MTQTKNVKNEGWKKLDARHPFQIKVFAGATSKCQPENFWGSMVFSMEHNIKPRNPEQHIQLEVVVLGERSELEVKKHIVGYARYASNSKHLIPGDSGVHLDIVLFPDSNIRIFPAVVPTGHGFKGEGKPVGKAHWDHKTSTLNSKTSLLKFGDNPQVYYMGTVPLPNEVGVWAIIFKAFEGVVEESKGDSNGKVKKMPVVQPDNQDNRAQDYRENKMPKEKSSRKPQPRQGNHRYSSGDKYGDLSVAEIAEANYRKAQKEGRV